VSECVCVCVPYQHEVDVEVEDLVAHVYAEVVAEVVSQVGERPGRALEVCTGHLHALEGSRESAGVCVCVCVCACTCVCVCVCLTSSDTLLSMAPSMECRAPTGNAQRGGVQL